ncbi:MAG: glycosyltransferase family 9 protein [Calditrichaeota bacterium]|nr:glycosyltransferase family 9 protein [Calditrichota bacterium]
MNRASIGSGDILVVRNDRLGDTILALPVIPALKERFPKSLLHFWTAPNVAPIIRCVQGIDSIIEGDDQGSIDVFDQIKSLNIQTVFCLRPTFSNAITLKKAGIPVRIGTGRRLYSPLFTHRVNITRKHSDRHEADLNLDMLAACEIDNESKFHEILIPDDATLAVEELLSQHDVSIDKRLVVIHPGSGGSAADWHPKYFKELADKLSGSHNVCIAVTGSDAEMQTCEQVAHDKHINLYGKTELLMLSALLRKAVLVISNSTGPLHLAVALGRRVLGLYPPLKGCLPERWGPYGHPDWALMPDLPLCEKCKPGSFSSCFCMEQLTPDFVYEHAMKALNDHVK